MVLSVMQGCAYSCKGCAYHSTMLEFSAMLKAVAAGDYAGFAG